MKNTRSIVPIANWVSLPATEFVAHLAGCLSRAALLLDVQQVRARLLVADPELRHLRARYRPLLTAALRDAIDTLSSEDRALY